MLILIMGLYSGKLENKYDVGFKINGFFVIKGFSGSGMFI